MLMNDLIKMRIMPMASYWNISGVETDTQNKSGSETETALPYFINLFFTWCS